MVMTMIVDRGRQSRGAQRRQGDFLTNWGFFIMVMMMGKQGGFLWFFEGGDNWPVTRGHFGTFLWSLAFNMICLMNSLFFISMFQYSLFFRQSTGFVWWIPRLFFPPTKKAMATEKSFGFLSLWTWTWVACELPKTFNLRTWVSEPPQNLKTQSLEPQPQILPRKVDSSAKDPG